MHTLTPAHRSNGRRAAAALLGILPSVLLCGSAGAQTPTVPQLEAGPCGIQINAPAKALNAAYHTGDWARFQREANNILNQLPTSTCKAAVPRSTDFKLLVWQGAPPVGERSLFTAVIPPANYAVPPDPFQLELPGLGPRSGPRLYQVFVADTDLETLAAVYVSTRQRNPLTEQIPDVAAAIVDPLLALASATQGTLLRTRRAERAREKAPPPGWVTVSRVSLPFERASVEVHLRATTPMTPAAVSAEAANLQAELELLDVRYSQCAKTLAEKLAMSVDSKKTACAASPGIDCLTALDPDFARDYQAQLKACGNSEQEVRALQLVDGKFRTLLVEMDAQRLPGKTDLQNTPLARFSFGVVSGLLLWNDASGTRVTVDDGVLVADPLDRRITMVVLNGTFKKYNPGAFDVTRRERYRWFAGAVVTPSFGVGGGVSALVVRGFAINAGAAVLGVTGAADGQAIGAAPADAQDPYKLEAAWGFFLGASFNFK